MRLSLKIVEPDSYIQKEILKAWLPDITRSMNRASEALKQGLPPVLKEAIYSSSEYGDILSGRLRQHFGMADPSSKLEGLIDIWTSNVDVKFKAPKIQGTTINSSLTIGMVTSDFSDVLGSSYAQVYDTERGYTLPWLSWLLLDGTTQIVTDYHIAFGNFKTSRAGGAVMRKGGSWGVPPAYAGTESDNWITRAVGSIKETDIESLLRRVF